MEKNGNGLPTLAELHMTPEQAFKNDQLNLLLNQPPHAKWIKKHPMYKNDYLPIDKVEYLLRRIFQEYRIEVLNVQQMFNSVMVHVRVHYKHPVSGQWSYHDGVGAKALQLNASAKASDLSEIKPEAVMLAVPMAKSYAIKDACDHFGKLFGGDLNRKDTEVFNTSYDRPEKQQPAPKETIDRPHYEEPSTQLKAAENDFTL